MELIERKGLSHKGKLSLFVLAISAFVSSIVYVIFHAIGMNETLNAYISFAVPVLSILTFVYFEGFSFLKFLVKLSRRIEAKFYWAAAIFSYIALSFYIFVLAGKYRIGFLEGDYWKPWVEWSLRIGLWLIVCAVPLGLLIFALVKLKKKNYDVLRALLTATFLLLFPILGPLIFIYLDPKEG